MFIDRVPGADIETLQAWVLESHFPWACWWFAKEVPGADKKALEQRVMEIGASRDCLAFARDIPGADKEALQARALAVLGEEMMADPPVPDWYIKEVRRIAVGQGCAIPAQDAANPTT